MLEIKRETTVTIYTTDGKPIKVGDMVVVESCERPCVGRYQGFTSKGSIALLAEFRDMKVAYNIMPKSVGKIYLAEVTPV